MNEEKEMFKAYLKELAVNSLSGKIVWSQPNPSTFQWVRSAGAKDYRVTIQRAKPRGLLAGAGTLGNWETFLFQVEESDAKEPVVSISSVERPELESYLRSVFDGAERSLDARAGSVLKRLLDLE